jgi:hypothetical protein
VPISRCFLTRDPFVLIRAFKTYVRPLVEYASPVWSPVSRAQIDKLEKVQRRFTKRLSGLRNMTYSARLQYLSLHSLERRRLNYDLMCYKIVHGMVDVNLSDFLPCLVLVPRVDIVTRLLFNIVASVSVSTFLVIALSESGIPCRKPLLLRLL